MSSFANAGELCSESFQNLAWPFGCQERTVARTCGSVARPRAYFGKISMFIRVIPVVNAQKSASHTIRGLAKPCPRTRTGFREATLCCAVVPEWDE